MNEILQQLITSEKLSLSAYVNAYVDSEDSLVHSIAGFQGIKAEFFCKSVHSESDIIKFLAVYSDLFSVFMLPNNTDEYKIHYYPPEDKRTITRTLTFDTSLFNNAIPEPSQFFPSYGTHSENGVRDLFKVLTPLIENQKCIIRPQRLILVKDKEASNKILYINSDTPNNSWEVKKVNEENSYVIANGLNTFQSESLLDITLPFLANVDVHSLTEILKDEYDILSTFRVELKKIMNSAVQNGNQNLREITNDILRPNIDTITRKFKHYENMDRLKSGGAIAAFTLSLIGIHIGINFNFQSLISGALGLLGPTVLGFVATEVSFRDSQDKLRDNPYFLLWKLSKFNGK
ncbi:hypothetical protein SAMN05216436_105221 [bacterium A37T11]|nr:hypothetical protein SAMN05216436_105221 [bacterium A37T11]